MWTGIILFFWPPARFVLTEIFELHPYAELGFIFSISWYYFVAVGAVLFLVGNELYKAAPQRHEEAERIWRKQEQWRAWFHAFQSGESSKYPTADVADITKLGFLSRPNEVCYVATNQAVLSRGNSRQLELSTQSNSGVELKGIKLGQATTTKETYSSVQYDRRTGSLLVTDQRVVFISVSETSAQSTAEYGLIEVKPQQIQDAAWSGTHVLLRTNLTSDENQNLLVFQITGELPAWLFAAAMFRLGVGSDASAPNPILPPT